MSFQPPSQQDPEQQPGSPFPPTTQMPPTQPFGAPSAPGQGAPGAPGAPAGFASAGGFPPAGQSGPPGGPFFNPAVGYTPGPPVKRGSGATLFTILVFLVPLLGLGVGAFIYFNSKDDADKRVQDALDSITVPEISIPDITIPTITIPPITVPENVPPTIPAGTETTVAQVTPTLPATVPPETVAPETVPPETVPPTVPAPANLWTPEGSAQVLGALETTISGDPSRFLTIAIYDTYAFADAQDANIPDHVDEYPYRDGVVGASSPVQLIGDGDLNASLFQLSDIDATQIPRLVAEAPALTKVEEPEVVYVRIERSQFIDGAPVTIKVYINGPRSSAYVEYDAAGTLLKVVE